MRRMMVELGWVFVSEVVFENQDGKDTLFVFHHKTKPLVIGLNQTEAVGVLFWSVLVITRSVVQLEDDIEIDGFAFGTVDFRSDREQCSVGYWQLFERTLKSTASMEEIAKAVTKGLNDLPAMKGKFDTIDVSFFIPNGGGEMDLVRQFDMMYFRHITRHVGGIDFKRHYPKRVTA